jgi:hypothetical protein
MDMLNPLDAYYEYLCEILKWNSLSNFLSGCKLELVKLRNLNSSERSLYIEVASINKKKKLLLALFLEDVLVIFFLKNEGNLMICPITLFFLFSASCYAPPSHSPSLTYRLPSFFFKNNRSKVAHHDWGIQTFFIIN